MFKIVSGDYGEPPDGAQFNWFGSKELCIDVSDEIEKNLTEFNNKEKFWGTTSDYIKSRGDVKRIELVNKKIYETHGSVVFHSRDKGRLDTSSYYASDDEILFLVETRVGNTFIAKSNKKNFNLFIELFDVTVSENREISEEKIKQFENKETQEQKVLDEQELNKKGKEIKEKVSTIEISLNYFSSHLDDEAFYSDLKQEHEYLSHSIIDLEESLSELSKDEKILYKLFYSDIYNKLSSIKDRYDDICEILNEESWIEEEDTSNSELEELKEEKEKINKNSKDTYYEISESNQSMESIFIELNNLIGISNVKKRLTEIVNLIQIQKERSKHGISNISINKHQVYYGAPGTGKTTIARLVGKFYKELGILSSGHFIEADRSMLIGGYLGQSALKTDEVLKSAFGGILFIDEAYSLYKDNDDYGKESIETILKYMEDNRENFILIVAGYKKPMKKFLNSNPGFKSRFNTFLEFNDYNQQELLEILIKLANESGYSIDKICYPKLNEIIKRILNTKDESFANARTMRNLLEKSIRQHANRLVSFKGRTKSDLLTLIKDDFSYDETIF